MLERQLLAGNLDHTETALKVTIHEYAAWSIEVCLSAGAQLPQGALAERPGSLQQAIAVHPKQALHAARCIRH